MSKIIGIDLGTTNSCVAVLEGGEPKVITNPEGNRTTPSVVAFKGDEEMVGETAKRQAVTNVKGTISSIKRKMGTSEKVEANGKKYTPEEISAKILAKLKKDAEAYLGEKVTKAVITVPAYFNDAERQATKNAGKIAGLEVERIINEPTAAALAYGLDKQDKLQTILVYDLGGGTFDVTIIRFNSDSITVLGTSGDRKLGGYDFDSKIIEAVMEEALENGIDISKDMTARQDLQLKAESAKKSLSSKDKTKITLNVGGQPFKYTLTKEDFLDLVEPLLYKTVSSMENACDEAGIEYEDLDKILLVGGSTRMPVVRDFIEEETGIIPSSEVHPDEAVAIGAAYHVLDVLKTQKAKSETTGSTKEDVQVIDIPEPAKKYSFTDVTSHGIGIVITNEYNEQSNSVILPKNVQVPAEKTNYYQTTVPYQETLKIQVTQGEEEDLRYVTIIGTAVIEITPREQIVGIEVTIACDENSIIHVRVYDQDLQCDLGEMHIDRVSNLSEEEVKRNIDSISRLNISGE